MLRKSVLKKLPVLTCNKFFFLSDVSFSHHTFVCLQFHFNSCIEHLFNLSERISVFSNLIYYSNTSWVCVRSPSAKDRAALQHYTTLPKTMFRVALGPLLPATVQNNLNSSARSINCSFWTEKGQLSTIFSLGANSIRC